MHLLRRLGAAFLASVTGAIIGATALAQAAMAQAPRDWEIGMQRAFSPVKERIESLHELVLVIIVLIAVFVAVLMGYVLIRFNHKRNPTPSRTSHNTVLEIAWTVLPVLILVIIAIPSFRLVYYEDRTTDPALTIKVTAHQWYWEYGYPDQGGFSVESRIIPDSDLKPGQLRLLDVDNQLIVPVGKNIRVLTNSTDVIHSFYIPSLGVQRYAIPGRTIETWFNVTQPGTYYGECNQICGMNHAYMPISVRAVPQAEFDAWAAKAKQTAAAGGSVVGRIDDAAPATTQIAAATTSEVRR